MKRKVANLNLVFLNHTRTQDHLEHNQNLTHLNQNFNPILPLNVNVTFTQIDRFMWVVAVLYCML